MKRSLPKALRAAIAFSFLSLAAHANDWPHWRGPTHDGISTEKGWATTWPAGGPKQLWTKNVGIGMSSFAVAGGRAYTMGNAGDTDTVFCFDAATGKEIWTHKYPQPLEAHYFEGGPRATPTVDGAHVLTLSQAGDLFCLDAATGKPLWQKNLVKDFQGIRSEWGWACSPMIEGNLIILDCGGEGSSTIALDKNTGALKWKSGSDKAGYGTPVAFNLGTTRCVAMLKLNALVGLDAATGRQLFSHPWKTPYDVNSSTLIVSGDKIFISTGYAAGCTLVQVSTTDAKELWRSKIMSNHINSCVLWQGHLYGVDGQVNKTNTATLRCLDFQTGKMVWAENIPGGSLMIADGKLIVLTEKGELMTAPASADGFKPTAQAQELKGRCWVVPVLANGRIYCRNNKGDVVCVDVAGK